MAEPTTYREVIEATLARIERRVYSADRLRDAPPRWVMALAPPLYRALDRNEFRRGPRP